MFSHMVQMYAGLINQLSGGDAIARGLISVWLLGVSTYLLRSVPQKLWSIIKEQFTSVGTLIEDGDITSDQRMAFVENYLIRNSFFKIRKKNFFRGDIGENIERLPTGVFYIWVGFRFFRIHKYSDPNVKDHIYYHLYITTIGRSTKMIEELVDQGRDIIGARYYSKQSQGYNKLWDRVAKIISPPRFFLDPVVKAAIDEKVIFFRDNKDWYIKNNRPYKLTIMLYGPPGTGKSSLILYISELLQSDISRLDLGSVNPAHLEDFFRKNRPGAPTLVAAEDFEKHARKRELTIDDGERNEYGKRVYPLDALLNTLQGIYPLNNIVTVLTTNHLEMVDEAVYRKGRTDLLLEVGPLGYDQVRDFYEYTYNQPFPSDIKSILPIKACDLNGLFEDHPQNADGFIHGLKKNYLVDNVSILKKA